MRHFESCLTFGVLSRLAEGKIEWLSSEQAGSLEVQLHFCNTECDLIARPNQLPDAR